jgi:hypothetical protein
MRSGELRSVMNTVEEIIQEQCKCELYRRVQNLRELFRITERA